MSKTQEQIDRMNTLTQQNVELAEINKELSKRIPLAKSDAQIAKQKIVDAINLAGGNATMDNSLSELAEIITAIMSNGVPLVGKDGEMSFDESAGLIDGAMSIIRNWDMMTRYVDKYSSIIPRYLGMLKDSTVRNMNQRIFVKSKYVEFTKATKGDNDALMQFIYMEELVLPEMNPTSASDYVLGSARNCFTYLKRLYMPKVSRLDSNTLAPQYGLTDGGFKDLIDITIGGAATTNAFWMENFQCTNAVDANSTSLLTKQDELDGFENNRQKFLWNLRNHFAALLGNTTDGVIRFHANVYNALDEDTTIAFTSKGWTITTP